MVAEAGFDFAELRCASTFPREGKERWEGERKRLLSYGIPIYSFNFLLPREMKVVGTDVSTNVLREYLDTVFYRISDLGGKHVSFGCGWAREIPFGFDRTRAEEQLISFIKLLSEMAETYLIQTNIELINHKETNMMVSLLEADQYAQSVNHPSIKVMADLYHMMEEQEPFSDIEKVAGNLGYVHLSDTGRLYPGSGDYPFELLFNTLYRIGYSGPVSVECEWKNDPEAEMKAAARFVKGVAKEAELLKG
jgi:sugar phosphate isomerase/epimerase